VLAPPVHSGSSDPPQKIPPLQLLRLPLGLSCRNRISIQPKENSKEIHRIHPIGGPSSISKNSRSKIGSGQSHQTPRHRRQSRRTYIRSGKYGPRHSPTTHGLTARAWSHPSAKRQTPPNFHAATRYIKAKACPRAYARRCCDTETPRHPLPAKVDHSNREPRFGVPEPRLTSANLSRGHGRSRRNHSRSRASGGVRNRGRSNHGRRRAHRHLAPPHSTPHEMVRRRGPHHRARSYHPKYMEKLVALTGGQRRLN